MIKSNNKIWKHIRRQSINEEESDDNEFANNNNDETIDHLTPTGNIEVEYLSQLLLNGVQHSIDVEMGVNHCSHDHWNAENGNIVSVHDPQIIENIQDEILVKTNDDPGNPRELNQHTDNNDNGQPLEFDVHNYLNLDLPSWHDEDPLRTVDAIMGPEHLQEQKLQRERMALLEAHVKFISDGSARYQTSSVDTQRELQDELMDISEYSKYITLYHKS